MQILPSNDAIAAGSVSVQDRIITLDILRGFAVMGILAMNIVMFAMPEMAYFNPKIYGDFTLADELSWAVNFIFVDGKMRGAFSILFGASMMVVILRASENGENASQIHFRRMGWLALFGLLHFYFIWRGDILFLYALSGSIAYLFIRLESINLVVLAIIIYVIGFLLISAVMGSIYWLQYEAQLPGADMAAVRDYQEVIQELTGENARELAIYKSGYAHIFQHRWVELRFQPIVLALQFIVETLPFMLIGMALLKNGFITGIANITVYRKWSLIGLLTGVMGYGLLAFAAQRMDYDPIFVMNISMAWSVPFRLVMTIGYLSAAILCVIVAARSGGYMMKILARVAAAGRAAFSNYIGTSIVMTSIFYGYGLGLFGEVSRSALWFFVIGGCALMLLWSKPWLARFKYGPLEWLWRSLVRGKFQSQTI